MERNKNKKDDRLTWINSGGGSFRLPNGKIIKPNQRFKSLAEDIPRAFRDIVVPFNKEDVEKVNTPIEGKANEYSLVPKSGGWFDVVDGEGKPVNDKSLREEDANELLKSLQ